MDTLVPLAQIALAIGLINVWLLRRGRSTAWRGGEAATLKEEFLVYGLPTWCMAVVGTFKLICAALLLVGIWVPLATVPAAIGLGVLMLGAVAMHAKVSDPLRKSLPALSMLALCLIVIVG